MEINPDLVHVVYSRADWGDTTPWLEGNVGAFNQTWYKLGRDPLMAMHSTWPGDEYRFLHEQDAMWFKMRWA